MTEIKVRVLPSTYIHKPNFRPKHGFMCSRDKHHPAECGGIEGECIHCLRLSVPGHRVKTCCYCIADKKDGLNWREIEAEGKRRREQEEAGRQRLLAKKALQL